MEISHNLEDLRQYHHEAIQFFAAELMLLKDCIPKIRDEKISQAATLLISAGRTGAALILLVNQPDGFKSESVMLARSFMEKVTNFCYVSICDEREYRAFVLHPIYKYFHNMGAPSLEEDLDFAEENHLARQKKQEEIKKKEIVREALSIFSEENPRLNWTKKTLSQRIDAIEKWGKLLDVFFRLSKIQYYSDASEALHGSLYGCTYSYGMFDTGFDHTKEEDLERKLLRDNACVILHLGLLVHQAFTLVSFRDDISETWDYSYKNQVRALNLWFHILGKRIPT